MDGQPAQDTAQPPSSDLSAPSAGHPAVPSTSATTQASSSATLTTSADSGPSKQPMATGQPYHIQDDLKDDADPTQPCPAPTTSATPPQDHEDLSLFSEKVKELSNMFPQIQPSILEAVLAAHGHDTSACISDLLAMSDPDYKPSHQDVVTQTDEELARQLDQQERTSAAQFPPSNPNAVQVPYQPRIKKTGANPSQQPWRSTQDQPSNLQSQQDNSTGKDELQKLTDELSKLAETGKKTMSTWLTKAKAKMQEMQQGNTLAGERPPEKIDTYEHVDHPNEINPSQNTLTPTRISPALPHRDRYNTPTNRLSSTTPGSNSEASAKAGPGKAAVLGTAAALGGTAAVVGATATSSSHQAKFRDDDEESLEYTRNPFEDDD